MKIKIRGGTAQEGDPSLCLSCRYVALRAFKRGFTFAGFIAGVLVGVAKALGWL